MPCAGGGPAFKLTLPHQIVHSHLLHLVDEGFELAPSAQVQTSWQASIAPRRNKERSEYTLQVNRAAHRRASASPGDGFRGAGASPEGWLERGLIFSRILPLVSDKQALGGGGGV